nr:bacterial Ig-like domain-containing protein [Streptomyces albicerus]
MHAFEAEQATRNHADLFSSSTASNGQYIGKIDFDDSHVTFTVDAPGAGTYPVTVHYANGTTGTSTHKLIVNDDTANPITVSYAPRGLAEVLGVAGRHRAGPPEGRRQHPEVRQGHQFHRARPDHREPVLQLPGDTRRAEARRRQLLPLERPELAVPDQPEPDGARQPAPGLSLAELRHQGRLPDDAGAVRRPPAQGRQALRRRGSQR